MKGEKLHEINKFYNADYCFGKFMDNLEESGLLDNTVVVYTSDHCTFADGEFFQAFPDSPRKFISTDRMPLIIYYPGVKPESINVNGRNSLCLAPTLLDLLDISEENYFLGDSLFTDLQSDFSTVFYSVEDHINTGEGKLREVKGEESRQFIKKINRYFAASRRGLM